MEHEITLGEFLSAEIKEAYRIVKGIFFGDVDTRTAYELSPFGIDSNPSLKDVITVYATTSNIEEPVIIGYLFKGKLEGVAPGETRIFSAKENGELGAFMWCKNDGNLLLQGDDDNAVRYSKLETAFNELRADFNSLVSTYNGHTHTVIGAVPAGGSPVVATATLNAGNSSVADITGAKIVKIKVNKTD